MREIEVVAGNNTFDIPAINEAVDSMISEMDAAVFSPVTMTVQLTRHSTGGNGIINETHLIQSLSDALCVVMLALQSYGFDVGTLAATSPDDTMTTLISEDDAERFLDGPTRIS